MRLRSLMSLAVLCCGIVAASGADIYVAQTSQGTGDGSNASNAQSLAWLNSSANWNNGVGTVQPGTTVHLVGTLTNTVTIGGSGAAGNRINIVFEPGANISMPVLAGIDLQSFNYITVDGAGGFMRSTDNGTAFGHQSWAWAIQSSASIGEITIQNVTATNLYARVASGDETGTATAINFYPANFNNVIIRGCTLSHAQVGINCTYDAVSTNLQVYSNSISHVNWGVAVGDARGTSGLHWLYIHHNVIDHFENWDHVPSQPTPYHHDGIYIFAQNSPSILNHARIYDNVIGPNVGDPNDTTTAIGCVGWDDATGVPTPDVAIFNNVCYLITGGWNNGFFSVGSSNGVVANNTVFANGILMSGIDSRGYAYYLVVNNIVMACGADSIYLPANWWEQPNKSDYNVLSPFGTGIGISWTSWQSTGRDLHGMTNDPVVVNALAGDFHLQATSPAIGAGTNLTSLGIPELNFDFDGNPRPATGPWTIGAYSATAIAPPIMPPGNLKTVAPVQQP